ncbi:MAG TPA: glycosyl hydrolase family 28-related protein [Ktedonobacteraceae bacterium]
MEDNLPHIAHNKYRMTRRQWMRRVPLPAIAASLGAELLMKGEVSAEVTSRTSSINDRGLRTYNIRDYGAKGDGVTHDTKAIQDAIDSCHKDDGGIVVVPAGVYLTGAIEIKSNITLHIAAAGKLLGSTDARQYHAIDEIPLHGDSTLEDGNWALIYAVNAKNVTIEGPGVIDGQGL